MKLQVSDSATSEKARQRTVAIENSALWAAAGDAIGWITELSRGTSGVLRRAGARQVTAPLDWERVIGGRGGPKVSLPAGTYSDDTQLRLAVSRSIRGDGSFDVEAFAKVEITVWPSYSLGGGVGTKTAAKNLSRSNVNWFSNFFETGKQKYVTAGGNGAAMRIQPHVWSASLDDSSYLLNVLRDSIVTHGHPHGFCGAVFHACCLANCLKKKEIPSPRDWRAFIDRFLDVPVFIDADPQLSTFWRSEWEIGSKTTIRESMEKMHKDALADIQIVESILSQGNIDSYHEILQQLGCLTPKYRGSGFKTALAAASLAFLFQDNPIEQSLVRSANELDSDTDTIATMAGAMLGGVSLRSPEWPIQDEEYIRLEAGRLAKIANGSVVHSFDYPDLGRWKAPATQNSSVGIYDGQFAIVGLGLLEPENEIEYIGKDGIWQWFKLPFGQTILVKRKRKHTDTISTDHIPNSDGLFDEQRASPNTSPGNRQKTLLLDEDRVTGSRRTRLSSGAQNQESQNYQDSVDLWSDEVIAAGFDDETLGRLLNLCIDRSNSIEASIAFAAIIAKAKLARKRRGR